MRYNKLGRTGLFVSELCLKEEDYKSTNKSIDKDNLRAIIGLTTS